MVAVEDDYLLGFAHGGFGPSQDGSTLAHDVGVVSTVLTSAHAPDHVAHELLQRVEGYLTVCGVKRLLAVGAGLWCPFYLGLYGGAELPGVLVDDPAGDVFRQADYHPQGAVSVYERSLIGFRPPIDRDLMQVRRSFHIEATLDPPAANWWDACTLADADRTEFVLETRDHSQQRGRMVFSEMEQLSNSWGVRAVGLTHWKEPDEGDQNTHLFLLGEAMRQLQTQGVSIVEAQLDPSADDSQRRLEMLQRLGFDAVDQGVQLWKAVE